MDEIAYFQHRDAVQCLATFEQRGGGRSRTAWLLGKSLALLGNWGIGSSPRSNCGVSARASLDMLGLARNRSKICCESGEGDLGTSLIAVVGNLDKLASY